MSRSTPSLLALLGLAAVAGYQNRDKLGTMLGGARARATDPSTPQSAGGFGGLFSDLGGVFDKSGANGGLAGGLNELVERFRAAGQGQKADSWVSTNPNQPIGEDDLNQVLDEETLAELSSKTGLTRKDLIRRLSSTLPETVDHLTPHGRVPTDDEG